MWGHLLILGTAGCVQVVSTSGDTHLGGEDFDHRVMDYFMKLVKRKYKVRLCCCQQ